MEAQPFDIETGMRVYGPGGQAMGRVTEVSGIGGTRLTVAPGSVPVTTEARSGTGYFKVDRTAQLGADAGDLCIPFHGIKRVVPGRDVIVTAAIVSEFGGRRDQGADWPGGVEVGDEPRKWRLWRPGRRQ